MSESIYGVPIWVKKIHPDAKLPQKSRDTDLGLDIFCVPDDDWDIESWKAPIQFFKLMSGASHTFRTGIQVATPPLWGFLLRDRSSYGGKDIVVSAGVIEGTYRGEWGVHLINHGKEPFVFYSGYKIVQAILTQIHINKVFEVNELPESDRSSSGWGSSGK